MMTHRPILCWRKTHPLLLLLLFLFSLVFTFFFCPVLRLILEIGINQRNPVNLNPHPVFPRLRLARLRVTRLPLLSLVIRRFLLDKLARLVPQLESEGLFALFHVQDRGGRFPIF